jgi:hypothetical protein
MESKTAIRASVCVRHRLRSISSHAKVAKQGSATALSEQSPTESIEQMMPARRPRLPKARLVYWQPWSE